MASGEGRGAGSLSFGAKKGALRRVSRIQSYFDSDPSYIISTVVNGKVMVLS